LIDDLTVAAGMEPVAVRPNSKPLVIPTGSGGLVDDDEDEETVVRKRITTPMPKPPGPYEPAPASGFNPWKILIPSMIGLLVIFAAIYAFTRRSPTPTTEAQPNSTLSADPNGQPVEPAQPPTGQAETGIPAGGITNVNANKAASPSPVASPSNATGVEPNINDNANDNSNTRKNPPLPSPTQSVDEGAPPPPTPKLPTPKPTLPPPSSSPPATPEINPPN
jgi:hypothetical protein